MRVQPGVTILNKATPDGESLRTTIPSFIVAQLEFEPGTRLKWELREDDKGPYILARPLTTKETKKHGGRH